MTTVAGVEPASSKARRSQLRVLHAIPSFLGGGAERQLAYLATGLRELGVEVDIAYLVDGPNSERVRASGAVLHPLGMRGALDVRLLWFLARIIQERRPDVVQTWLPRMDIYGGLAANLTRLPWIYSERYVWLPTREVVANLRWKIVQTADAVVANSNAGSHHWKRLGMEVHVVPNAIPLHEIDAVAPLDRGRIDVPEDAELILFAGRFNAQKNIPLLERALSRVLAARPRAFAICCGIGELLPAFERGLAAANLTHRVRTPGYREDLWALMKTADLLVSPSFHEGRPNVVIEAMACGCPVVLSDIAEHRECAPSDAALFFPTDDAEIAAAALESTLADHGAAKARARRARSATEAFGVLEMARSYERVYRDLADARRRGVR